MISLEAIQVIDKPLEPQKAVYNFYLHMQWTSQRLCPVKAVRNRLKSGFFCFSISKRYDVCASLICLLSVVCARLRREKREGVKRWANMICTLTALAPCLIKMGASTYSKQMLFLSLVWIKWKRNCPAHWIMLLWNEMWWLCYIKGRPGSGLN